MRDKEIQGSTFLSFIPIVLGMLVLLFLGIWGLSSAGIVTLPFGESHSSEVPEDSGEVSALLDRLAGVDAQETVSYEALAPSAIRHILATGTLSNSYLHEYTITYGDTTVAAESFSVLRRNADFHLLVTRNGVTIREILYSKGQAEFADADSGVRAAQEVTASSYFEQMTGTVSALDLVNFVINFKDGSPSEWKFGTVQTCTLESLRQESVNMARITLGYSDRTEVYLLDIDRGYLLSYESLRADKTIVRMQTKQFTYDITGIGTEPVLLK
ncbi:MAG: hypothetical protein SPJ23_02940 [Eubacteriales bacterium]|nr:hypothetical protein [Eubacteriales bacterium]